MYLMFHSTTAHLRSFTGNRASQGGVMYMDNSDIRLIACNFTRNNATNGGVFQVTGYLFIAHCIMNNNTADGDGGVGYVEQNSHIKLSQAFLGQIPLVLMEEFCV